MPSLTIRVSHRELAQLTRLGEELDQSPSRTAERLLHLVLARRERHPPAETARQKATSRALRHLQLMRLLQRRRLETIGQAEKQELARRFGVTERTIYRDLDVVQQARYLDTLTAVEAAIASTPATDEPAPAAAMA